MEDEAIVAVAILDRGQDCQIKLEKGPSKDHFSQFSLIWFSGFRGAEFYVKTE